MKQPKHTPGPWKWLGTQGNPEKMVYLSGAEHKTVLCDFSGSVSNNLANAQLIASAPELLDALRQLETAASLVQLEDNSDTNPDAARLREKLVIARLALTKALSYEF